MSLKRREKNLIQKSCWGALGEHPRRPISWTYTFVVVSWHNLESSRTWGLRIQCLHYKPVQTTFARGGGGGYNPLVEPEVTKNSKEEDFLPNYVQEFGLRSMWCKKNYKSLIFFYRWWSFIIIRYILICSSFFYKMAPVKCKIYVMYYGEIRALLAVRNAPNNFKIKSVLF